MSPGESAAASPGEAPPRVARRRVRLARGPVTIGEPAPAIEPRLAGGEPYRPDTIADGGSALGLTVRAASVRGLHKRFVGGPRQDDLCLRVHAASRTLIAAVADGVSGAARSDLGAALAVRYATAAVARQLDAGSIDWPNVFEQAAWALVSEERRTDSLQTGSLATTLLVAAVSAGDDGAVAVQAAAVGDSPAFRLHGKQYDALVGQPVHMDDLIGGGVQALPRDAGTAEVGDCALAPGDALLLCTDGLALPLAGGTGELGRAFARELATPPDVVDFARLLDFSRSTYDDDRTLVAVWVPR
ncbi:MAG TPA: protein phosphatase 2C domain-containing protein [Solirubrobacteraceae bacterium]|nr:protein phosphatase 2C domain-containing protein [Solirubrobacteraceae bacterium]